MLILRGYCGHFANTRFQELFSWPSQKQGCTSFELVIVVNGITQSFFHKASGCRLKTRFLFCNTWRLRKYFMIKVFIKYRCSANKCNFLFALLFRLLNSWCMASKSFFLHRLVFVLLPSLVGFLLHQHLLKHATSHRYGRYSLIVISGTCTIWTMVFMAPLIAYCLITSIRYRMP